MHTDKINPNLTGRFVQPSPNYQRLRPSLTQAQREIVAQLREAFRASLPDYTEKVEPEFSNADARIIAALTGTGKSTLWTRYLSDIHFAMFEKGRSAF
jgi:hypothetical protein